MVERKQAWPTGQAPDFQSGKAGSTPAVCSMQLIGLTKEELEQHRAALAEQLETCSGSDLEREGSLMSALDEIDFALGEIEAGRPSPLQ